MSLDLPLNRGSTNPVIFLMSAHETNVDNSELVVNGYHNTIRIAFEVEDNPIVSYKAGVTVNTLDVSWGSPLGPLSIGIPYL
jgi:hypothetical protein